MESHLSSSVSSIDSQNSSMMPSSSQTREENNNTPNEEEEELASGNDESLEDLPSELQYHIFEYLPPLDLIQCGATCRQFYQYIEFATELWVEHCYELWHDKQVVSRTRREIREGFRRIMQRIRGDEDSSQQQKKAQEDASSNSAKERLPIKTLKYLLEKYKVDYSDCFTRASLEERYEDYLRKKSTPKEIKVLDKLFEECHKPKFVYFKSIRQSKSTHIPLQLLCTFQWVCSVKPHQHDNWGLDGLLPEFRNDFVYYSNGQISPLKWRMKDLGHTIQLGEYPPLVVSRRDTDWGFILENHWVSLTSVSPHRRVDATIPLNVHELMRAATEAKKDGNSYYAEGEFRAAMMEYKAIFHILKRAVPPPISETATIEDNRNAELIANNLRKLKFTVYSNLASCHLQLKDWLRAKCYADKALTFDKTSAKAFYKRGRAHFELGNLVEADHDLTEASLLSRDSNPAINDLLRRCRRRLDVENTSFCKFSYSNYKETG